MSEQRELLEARLAQNPASPVFIRLAFMHLEEGRVDEALKLGLEGRKRFPRYATGSLLLGKCFQASGRMLEALLEYRSALRELPDNPMLRALLSELEIRRISEYRLFAETKRKALQEETRHWSFDEFLAGKAEAPPPQPPPVKKTAPPEPPAAEAVSEAPSRIVTPTLAEIYASQGEYTEAIAAYRRLRERRPEDAERFDARVQELEELAKRQQNEKESKEEEEG